MVQEEASVGTRPVPWFYALWFRVMVVIGVVGAALYVLVVPAALVFLAVGSIECLGPSCAPAQTGTLVFGALAVAIGIAAIALLIAFAIRPTGRRLLIGIVGLAVLPLLLAGQVWGTSTLSKGRAVTDAAMQLAFAIDDDAVTTAGCPQNRRGIGVIRHLNMQLKQCIESLFYVELEFQWVWAKRFGKRPWIKAKHRCILGGIGYLNYLEPF